MLLPHFSRHVLYRWLHSLWKSVMYLVITRSFSLTDNASLFARWQQTTTAHLASGSTCGRESTQRLVFKIETNLD